MPNWFVLAVFDNNELEYLVQKVLVPEKCPHLFLGPFQSKHEAVQALQRKDLTCPS